MSYDCVGELRVQVTLMLTERMRDWKPYVDEGAQAYEDRYREQRIQSLAARAKALGYQLIPVPD